MAGTLAPDRLPIWGGGWKVLRESHRMVGRAAVQACRGGMDRRRQLAEALGQYRPVGTDEATFRRRMLDLLAGPGDPFARDRFDPGHFTASAFVLGEASHGLLMIHHRRLGRWLQPGGHVEQDDVDLCSAAQREVAEEAGLRGLTAVDPAPFDLDIHTIPERPGQPEHLHLDVRFLFRAPAHALSPASDAAAARWVALEEVARLNGEPAMATSSTYKS